eukprot:7612655-Ditylum_brightwellii.AAC.1
MASFPKGLLYPRTQHILQRFILQRFMTFWAFPVASFPKGLLYPCTQHILQSCESTFHSSLLACFRWLASRKGCFILCTPSQGLIMKSAIRQASDYQ